MSRRPLGIALQDAFGVDLPAMPQVLQQPVPQFTPTPQAPQRMGKGQLIMGILADVLAGAQGRPGQFAAQLGQQRQQEREQAQEQARWHRDRTAGIEDFRTRQEIEQRYRPPPTPYRFEDNAGNVWQIDSQTGEPQRIFTDRAPRQMVHDGMLINVPNPYASPTTAPVPPAITEDLWNTGTPVGGQASAPGTFPRSR